MNAAAAYLRLYTTLCRLAISTTFQYRLNNLLYLVGMVAEPVVYLVVWSSIARREGGSLEGYTPGTFAAYYIVWTLVRSMNITFTPFGWEERIREGTLVGPPPAPGPPGALRHRLVRRMEVRHDPAVAARGGPSRSCSTRPSTRRGSRS